MKGYLTKDLSGVVTVFYGNKPEKENDYWESWDSNYFCIEKTPDGLNPKWEDNEPIEIEIEIHARS